MDIYKLLEDMKPVIERVSEITPDPAQQVAILRSAADAIEQSIQADVQAQLYFNLLKNGIDDGG